MKKYLTSLLVLFLLLMATGRAAAAEINSVMLNRCISSYGDTSWSTQDGLYSGMGNEPLNLTNSNPEGVNVFVLNSFTANVTGKLTSLVMKSRIYESGTTAPDAWQTLTAAEYGNQWMCEANYNVLSGLTYHKTYLLEFYFEGTDDQGNLCYLRNGEGNFVYTFYTGGVSDMGINYLYVQVNMGSGAESQQIPQYDMPEVDLSDESETDFLLSGFTAYAFGISSLKMNYSIYPASGTASEWKSVTATQSAEDPNQWVCTTSIDVLEGLTVGETYVLEFNFQGSNGIFAEQDCWYNNGGSNYKIRFTKAEKVLAFLDGETAGLRLNINGRSTDFTLTGQGGRTPATASLGNLSTLTCDAAWLKAQLLKSGLTFSSVRMAYVIYGWQNDKSGNWYYVNLTKQADQGSAVTQFSSNGDAVDLLAYRKSQWYLNGYNDYTLEVRYELQTSDGNTYRLGNGDAYKFTFTYMEESSTYIEKAFPQRDHQRRNTNH